MKKTFSYLSITLVIFLLVVFTLSKGYGREVGPFGSITRIIDQVGTILRLETDGSMPVMIQDQTTPALIAPLVHLVASTTTTVQTAIDSHSVTVASTASFIAGQHIRVVDSVGNRIYFGEIISIASPVVTVDSPFDYAFPIGSQVTVSSDNMAVNGSVTPVSFTLRTGSPSITSSADITKFIISCTTSSAVDLNKFCSIAPLTKGLVMRMHNGEYHNIFNIKSNHDLASLTYDWTPYIASNPALGIDGFVARLRFAGQDNAGVAIRVAADENIEVIIQDDLSALTEFRITAITHIVQ